jgi:murein DD-endopeptidase MepM/ murein hydrolase activator NlpD
MSLRRRASLLFFLVVCLNGCGHFQGKWGEFRGPGAYRRPSDYSGPTVSGANLRYSPQAPFRLVWPVDKVRISRGFKRSPLHEGVDLAGRRGMPIHAAHEGQVIYAGQDFRGYGKMVILEYDRKWATLYGHLNSISVKEGDIVRHGEILGGMGRTGRASGVHLHFELLHKRQPVDPLTMLERVGPVASARE